MNKELFTKYAALKVQEKQIKEEIAMINPDILKSIEEAGADKVDTEEGTFSIAKKKTWAFSKEINTLELNIKEEKKNEMADGTATYIENPYLLFKVKEPKPTPNI